MTFPTKVLTLGLFLLPAVAGAQTPSATPQKAPCINVSAKPAADSPKLGRMVGISSGAQPAASDDVCPLTAAQKLGVWVRKSYSPVNMLSAAAAAAIWQASQPASEGGYGQGWDAYGSRFGASFANAESARFFQSFLFPALLKEDPRYFREARGTGGHRFGYAISRVLVARTDSGHHRFNFSEVMGAFAAAGLTNTYYPEADRTAAHTMRAAGINLATSAGWNVLYEFGPDILHKLRGKNKK